MEDIDPLIQAHLDLAKDKTPTHFDAVLDLENTAKAAFNKMAEKYFYKKTSSQSKQSGKRQGSRHHALKPK